MPLAAWKPLLFAAPDDSVALFSVANVWGMPSRLPRAPYARLVDYSAARDGTLPESPFRSVIELTGPSLSLKNGLVLLAMPTAPREASTSRGTTSGSARTAKLAVIDVAGGCCRKGHAFHATKVAPFRDIPAMLGFASSAAERREAAGLRAPAPMAARAGGRSSLAPMRWQKQLQEPATGAKPAAGWGSLTRAMAAHPERYPEHALVYHAISARSTTFFHALATSAPKLLLALPLLRDRASNVTILVSGPIMPSVVRAFGIDPARLLLWYGPATGELLAVRARRLLVPAGLDDLPKSLLSPPGPRPLMHAARQLMRSLIVEHSMMAKDHSMAKEPARGVVSGGVGGGVRHTARYDQMRGKHILVVRREAFRGHTPEYCLRHGYRPPCGHPGRAVLNHDELLAALREAFPGWPVVDFSPEPRAIEEQVRLWAEAALVIAPHGAGLTNLLFLPPRGCVLEFRAKGRKGAVYKGLGLSIGTRHEECVFDHTHVANAHALRRNGPDMNVLLPMPYVFGCLRERFADLRPPPKNDPKHQASSTMASSTGGALGGALGVSLGGALGAAQGGVAGMGAAVEAAEHKPLFTAEAWARIDALATAKWAPKPVQQCNTTTHVRIFGVCVPAWTEKPGDLEMARAVAARRRAAASTTPPSHAPAVFSRARASKQSVMAGPPPPPTRTSRGFALLRSALFRG